MTHQRARLQDKYRPLALIAVLLLCCSTAFSQNYTQTSAWGYDWRNGKFQTSLAIPNDTFAIPVAYRNMPFIAYKDSLLYTWSPGRQRWNVSGTAGGSGGVDFLTKQNYSDTTTYDATRFWVLSNYPTVARFLDSMTSGRLRYMKFGDTASLSNRIDAIGTSANLVFDNGLYKIGNKVNAYYNQPIWSARDAQGIYFYPGTPLHGQGYFYDSSRNGFVLGYPGGSGGGSGFDPSTVFFYANKSRFNVASAEGVVGVGDELDLSDSLLTVVSSKIDADAAATQIHDSLSSFVEQDPFHIDSAHVTGTTVKTVTNFYHNGATYSYTFTDVSGSTTVDTTFLATRNYTQQTFQPLGNYLTGIDSTIYTTRLRSIKIADSIARSIAPDLSAYLNLTRWLSDSTALWNQVNTNTTAIAGKLSNITGLITQGTNVTITGSGTSGSPYVINSSGSANAFVNNGNAFGATSVFGNTDNYALSFLTNNTERARITSDGNFLVGTTVNTGNPLRVVGAPRFDLGSDATGDIFYRDASGNFTRLGIGSASQVLTVSGGLPSWQTASSGGTPGGSSGQIQYNNAGAFGGFGSWDGTTLGTTALTLTARGTALGFNTTGTVAQATNRVRSSLFAPTLTSTAQSDSLINLDLAGAFTTTNTSQILVADLRTKYNAQFGYTNGDAAVGINKAPPTSSGVTLTVRARSTASNNPVLQLENTSGQIKHQFWQDGTWDAGLLELYPVASSGGNNTQIRATAQNSNADENNVLITALNNITKTTAGTTYSALAIGSYEAGSPTGRWQPTSGSAKYAALKLSPYYNATGTATGSVYDLYINPTVTALGTGAVHYSIYATSGRVHLDLSGVPTYADDAAAGTGGLIAGDVYKTSTGQLMIKL